MKKILILTLMLLAAVLTSCASKTNVEQKSQNEQKSQKTVVKENIAVDDTLSLQPKLSLNSSYLSQENVGETISVSGKLLNNGNSFTLIENPDSRSRVSFILEVTDAETKKTLQEFAGKIVTLTGELTDASSTWTKRMKVLKIE